MSFRESQKPLSVVVAVSIADVPLPVTEMCSRGMPSWTRSATAWSAASRVSKNAVSTRLWTSSL